MNVNRIYFAKQALLSSSESMNPTLVLETTAYTLEQLQHDSRPQVALAGRSNVGKSSLVNALAGRKQLAKTSGTPGKTRSVNYYLADPDNFLLVDLPGYGYARAAKTERENWGRLIERYLVSAPSLRGLLLLLDCRLPPQQSDLALLAFAAANAIPVLPVLTKADKCSRKEQLSRQREWAVHLPRLPLLTSSLKRAGMDALWQALRDFALIRDNKNCVNKILLTPSMVRTM